MSFATTHTLMKTYNINDKGVEDDRLEFPINDWLFENNKLEVLAGAIHHPDCERGTREDDFEDGMLLVTQFLWQDRIPKDPSSITLTEGTAEQSAEAWLVDGGADSEDLEWLCIWDTFGLTKCGVRPKYTNVRGPRPQPLRLIGDELMRWLDAGSPNPKDYFSKEELEQRLIAGKELYKRR